jgi:hypothetical protein
VFNELAAFEAGSGADERDEVGASTARQRSWAASISLNAMAIQAALEPGHVRLPADGQLSARWRS